MTSVRETFQMTSVRETLKQMVWEMSMEMIIIVIILSTSDESASDQMVNLFQALGDGIPLRAEKAAYSISSKELV